MNLPRADGGFDVVIGGDVAIPRGPVDDFDRVTNGGFRAVIGEAQRACDPKRPEPMRSIRIYTYTVGLATQIADGLGLDSHRKISAACSTEIVRAVQAFAPHAPVAGIEGRAHNVSTWRAWCSAVERELNVPGAMLGDLTPAGPRLAELRDELLRHILDEAYRREMDRLGRPVS